MHSSSSFLIDPLKGTSEATTELLTKRAYRATDRSSRPTFSIANRGYPWDATVSEPSMNALLECQTIRALPETSSSVIVDGSGATDGSNTTPFRTRQALHLSLGSDPTLAASMVRDPSLLKLSTKTSATVPIAWTRPGKDRETTHAPCLWDGSHLEKLMKRRENAAKPAAWWSGQCLV
ncbi:hypothetical protein LIA77_00391 [Sarocladium implicatum]|nr:hypothetical protein LIA77_00391 [Sarocladium implicatum]